MRSNPLDQFAQLTIIPEGDEFVVGNAEGQTFVVVPIIGAQILGWLRAGATVDQCTVRATRLTGEPVNVVEFLDTLTSENILSEVRDVGPPRASWLLPIARATFSAPAWAVYLGLALMGSVLLVTRADLRPGSDDMVIGSSAIGSLLMLTASATVLTLLHELGHVLAAVKHGISSTLTISRRLFFVTAQADLTGLWSLPRRSRYGPLLAGMAWDAASVGLLLGLETWRSDGLPDLARQLLRAAVLVQISALAYQCAVFARTDLYAVLRVATGTIQLNAVKTAVLGTLLGRTTEEDRLLLASTPRRELTWARRYLGLYLVGMVGAGWYLLSVTLPGLLGVIRLAHHSIASSTPHQLEFYEGWTAVVTITVPTIWAIGAGGVATVRAIRGPEQTPIPRAGARRS